MVDGRGNDEPDEGAWREHEQVDEQYAEPDEPDPSDLGPGVPEPPDPSTNDVDPFLQRRFWALVLVFNVALLALSLGAMFAVFEGDYGLAARLLAVGLAALGFGLYRYRTTKRKLAERSDDPSPDDPDSDDPGPGDPSPDGGERDRKDDGRTGNSPDKTDERNG